MYIAQIDRQIAYITFKSIIKEIESYNAEHCEKNVWEDIYGIALKQYVKVLKKAAR